MKKTRERGGNEKSSTGKEGTELIAQRDAPARK